jgi:hypothetical protein
MEFQVQGQNGRAVAKRALEKLEKGSKPRKTEPSTKTEAQNRILWGKTKKKCSKRLVLLSNTTFSENKSFTKREIALNEYGILIIPAGQETKCTRLLLTSVCVCMCMYACDTVCVRACVKMHYTSNKGKLCDSASTFSLSCPPPFAPAPSLPLLLDICILSMAKIQEGRGVRHVGNIGKYGC